MLPHFLITRLTSSFTHYKSTQIPLGSLLQHRHYVFLFSFNSFTSGRDNHKGVTFTVSYLINSCGLSPELAYKLSNGVSLKTPNGPNAVLDTLKDYGFSKTEVAKLVEKHPRVLVANAEKTLLPKLQFFHSIGVSNTDMSKMIIKNPLILRRSLAKFLVPLCRMIRRVVHDDLEVVKVLRKSPFAFTYADMVNGLVPNIEVLRQSGVPQGSISLLMVHFPSVAYGKHSRFVEAVKRVKKFGFDPLKTAFVMAIQVLYNMRKLALELRFEIYERWGWNREMALQAFVKYPNFIKLSDEMVTKKMNFLVKDMGLSPEYIAAYPTVLGYNLEKRIVPRLSVIKILKSKGLVKNNLQSSSFLCITEEIFLKKFVINFQEDLPLLPDVYKGLIHHENVI
ncbi:hypothetical protein AAZX31_18G102400 [Glycine max]|uniref:Transcription termination factor MTERF6, chloroplastic/mitochondrial isoform B n=1 Tax=Glycine soja TaxID=3848 RepID=A0A445FRL2_GLYSO|nr:hypothetical protein GLYMA_18G107500v4 [Glycine max]KHN18090.1 hypothetical protein glysoja_020863 [Glycine soja]KAG4920977.1 hypothetical protein JHK86_049790 [Glycine max]KAG4935623.1 hypothetical protein JHK85_050542 [Glycine max]KAG5091135.1 hypothetical protein JHK82_049913 [Glycine max]|eukprot:XP_003551920.1 transcription termination factor MTERF15, mitochondrial isoform X1 [Glycine max]